MISNNIKIENKDEIIVDTPPNWFPWLDIKSGDINRVYGIDVFEFIDHVKFVKDVRGFPDIDEVMVVSEPYNLNMYNLINLIKFCEIFELGFTVSGDSSHNPGKCFRIVFYRK